MVTSLTHPSDGLNNVFFLVFFEGISVTIQILSLLFNGAIICTLWKKSLLQYPSNRFVQSLCLSHLLVSLLIVLISIVQPFLPSNRSLLDTDHASSSSSIFNGSDGPPKTTGEITSTFIILNASFRLLLSHTILYATFGVVLGTSLTVACIAIDRYQMIAKPMKYKSIVTPKKTTGIIFTIWVICSLAAVLPILVSDNETLIFNSSFAIPIGGLRLYFAIVFLCVTLFSLVIMSICYFHIYTIAKTKCLKVQIGHFTSAPSNISSADWPSYNNTSHDCSQIVPHHHHNHQQQHQQDRHHHQHNQHQLNTGTKQIRSSPTSPNLLHFVLIANAGRNLMPTRLPENMKATSEPNLKDFSTSYHGGHRSNHHSINNNLDSPPLKPKRTPSWRSWRFLKPSYNSPKKTFATITMLVGSVILTQFPLIWVLFTPQSPQFLFFFCYKVLFALSSLSNPVLYGLLNRTIRIQLWKLLKLDRRLRNNKRTINVKTLVKKASISSAGGSCQIASPRLLRKVSASVYDLKNSLSHHVIRQIPLELPFPLIQQSQQSIQYKQSPIVTANVNNQQGGPNANNSKMVLVKPRIEIEGASTGSSSSAPPSPILGESLQQKLNSENIGDFENDQTNESSPMMIYHEEYGLKPSSSFSRKSSQDSGADMTFSDNEEEDIGHERVRRGMLLLMGIRSPETIPETEGQLIMKIDHTADSNSNTNNIMNNKNTATTTTISMSQLKKLPDRNQDQDHNDDSAVSKYQKYPDFDYDPIET